MAIYPRKNDQDPEKENPPVIKRRRTPSELMETYGEHVRMRHDWVDRLDKKVAGSDKTYRQILEQFPDIDNPALFMASILEEGGASWQDKALLDNGDEYYRQAIAEGKYPYSGFGGFGLDTIGNRVDEFIKKGLLPADFKNRIQIIENMNEKNEVVKGGNFRSMEDIFAAKRAYFKAETEAFEKFAKENNLELSDNAKDFFRVVAYNGGQGLSRKMADSWSKNGMLEHDRFLKEAPPSDSYYQTWLQNIRRIQGANMLIGESGVKGREIKWTRPQTEIINPPNRDFQKDIFMNMPQRRKERVNATAIGSNISSRELPEVKLEPKGNVNTQVPFQQKYVGSVDPVNNQTQIQINAKPMLSGLGEMPKRQMPEIPEQPWRGKPQERKMIGSAPKPTVPLIQRQLPEIPPIEERAIEKSQPILEKPRQVNPVRQLRLRETDKRN